VLNKDLSYSIMVPKNGLVKSLIKSGIHKFLVKKLLSLTKDRILVPLLQPIHFLVIVDRSQNQHLELLYKYFIIPYSCHSACRNPTLAKCGGEAQHLEKLEVGSLSGLPKVQSSIARGKTPHIGAFLMSLKRS
jgi:hypothetical protein